MVTPYFYAVLLCLMPLTSLVKASNAVPQPFHLLEIGGAAGADEVYLHQLDKESAVCELPKLPKEAKYRPKGAKINGNVTVCGGGLDTCVHIDQDKNPYQWIPSYDIGRRRYSTALTTFDDKVWTIFGGHDNDERETMTIIEEGVVEIEQIPIDMEIGFCSLRKNQTHGIVAKSELYAWYEESSRKFTIWEPFPDEPFFLNAVCGLIHTDENDYQFVLAGGSGGSKAVFVFDFEHQTWAESAELPFTLGFTAHLQFQDSFIILGGTTGATYTDKVLLFDQETGWTELEMRLTHPNRFMGLLRVTRHEVKCPNEEA